MKQKVEILVVVTIVLCCVQTSYTAPTRYDYGQVLSVSAANIPSKSKVNKHQVDNSMTAKLLQTILSSAQGSPVKLPLTLPAQRQDQGQADEQMKALVDAIGEQMMVDTHGSKEELERALQQLFDMPSFPIIRLYPNDG